MVFNLVDLGTRTREFMLDEFGEDVASHTLQLSKRFTPKGAQEYPALLEEAIESGTPETLAAKLSAPGMFVSTEQRRTPSGGVTMARVPANAPEVFAEGEFNRMYIRGICRRALAAGQKEVEIYRAKQVVSPRPDSAAKVGKHIGAEALLVDLRANKGVDTALGLPSGPNSGLSVRLCT